MFCTQCGNSLNEGQVFCDNCGIPTVTGNSIVQVSGENKQDKSLSGKDSVALSELSSSLSKLSLQVTSVESQLKSISARLNKIDKGPDSAAAKTQSHEEEVMTVEGVKDDKIDSTLVKKKNRWLRVLLTVLAITIVTLILVVLIYTFRSELLDQVEDWGMRTDWLRQKLMIY